MPPVAIADPTPSAPGGGGCNCDCPDEETLANKVIEKLNESEDSSHSSIKSKGRMDWESESDEYAENIKTLEKKTHFPAYSLINKTIFLGSVNVTFNTLEETLPLIDIPLDELTTQKAGDYSGMMNAANGLLTAVGVDMSVLTLREVPQIVSCAAISAGGLWDYFKHFHECVHEIIDKKLAQQAPEDTAEKIAEETRKEKILTAQEATSLISQELSGNATTRTFDAFFKGWDNGSD